MLIMTAKGLYCPAGNFYIDPSGAVEHAVITHAHSDHARRGSKNYYCASSGVNLLKTRLGQSITVKAVDYRDILFLDGIAISFHPAGHILGSSQVRIEFNHEVWVVSGDYKREADPTCDAFETVECDVFITEATFGTPAFNWDKNIDYGQSIFRWWQKNAAAGFNSIIFAYSLGKAQRILGSLAPYATVPIYCHPATEKLNLCYREQGVNLASSCCITQVKSDPQKELFLVPLSFFKSEYAKLVGNLYKTAFASGWMTSTNDQYDETFMMSDHADWNDLLRTILSTKAKRIYVQHRGKGALVKKLRSLGLHAYPDSELIPKNSTQLSLF